MEIQIKGRVLRKPNPRCCYRLYVKTLHGLKHSFINYIDFPMKTDIDILKKYIILLDKLKETPNDEYDEIFKGYSAITELNWEHLTNKIIPLDVTIESDEFRAYVESYWFSYFDKWGMEFNVEVINEEKVTN